MLNYMENGSVIVDVAVDQGGCVETCKPTTHKNPTYSVDGILHYCVSNMPGAVPYTSTIALTNITLPYIVKICRDDMKELLHNDLNLAKGLNIYKGQVTHEGVASTFNLSFTNYKELI